MAIDTGRSRRLQDAVERTAGRTPAGSGYVSLESQALPLEYRDHCLTLVTLQHDGELGGGVVIIDPAAKDSEPWVVGAYAGARQPFVAGPGRVGFTYTSARGSGLYESRVVVLCALGGSIWHECLSVTRDSRTTVYGRDPLLHAEQSATVRVVGDTLIVRRTVSYEREGERARRTPLQVSRLVLPPVP